VVLEARRSLAVRRVGPVEVLIAAVVVGICAAEFIVGVVDVGGSR
jgi:hypothetical protein